jgi:hypothetical protein
MCWWRKKDNKEPGMKQKHREPGEDEEEQETEELIALDII